MRAVEASDYAMIDSWHNKRGIDGFGIWPPIGLIVPEVAAGFLVRTDSSCAFLEGFVTNKDAMGCDRALAVEEIGLELVRIAQTLGYKQVLALTRSDMIGSLATSRGFVNTGLSSLYKKEL